MYTMYDIRLNFLYDNLELLVRVNKTKLTVDTVIFLFQWIQNFFAVAFAYLIMNAFSVIPQSQNISAAHLEQKSNENFVE